MKTEISVLEFFCGNTQLFLEKKEVDFPVIRISTERIRGIKSEHISIEFKKGYDLDENEPYISCDLNYNQALHIKKSLEAFLEEINIDE